MKLKKSVLLLATATSALLNNGAFACTETVTADLTVTGAATCQYILSSGTLIVDGSVVNSGPVYGVQVLGTSAASGLIVNSGGSISEVGVSPGSSAAVAVGDGTNTATLGMFVNYGILQNPVIQAGEVVLIVSANATLGSFINYASGVVQSGPGGGAGGSVIDIRGTVGNLTNSGLMTSKGNVISVGENGHLTSLYNLAGGIIRTSQTTEVINAYGSVGTIVNDGLIDGYDYYGIAVYNDYSTAAIGNIVNRGVIKYNGDQYGAMIANFGGAITTLENYQGVNGSGGTKLVYAGNLPTNYKVIASGANYGQVLLNNDAASLVGSTAFGISGLSGKITQLLYNDVVSGSSATSEKFSNYQSGVTNWGTFRGANWRLVDADGAWNLVFDTRPSVDAALTRLALQANRNALNFAALQRSNAINNSLDYECASFDKNNMCVSFRARYSGFDNQSEGAGVLTAGYRFASGFRVGGFIDLSASQNNIVGLRYGDEQPILGGFAAYSDQPSGAGLQAKIAAAYNSGNVTIKREGNAELNTEAANGVARLSSFGVKGELGWGFSLNNQALVTPYVGLRYGGVTRGAYAEKLAPSIVDFPISYASYADKATTALAGLRYSGMFSEKLGYQAGVEFEYDLNRNSDNYSGTSSIHELDTFSLANPQSVARSRANASAGLFYAFASNQKLTANAVVRRQAYRASPNLTVMTGYEAAF